VETRRDGRIKLTGDCSSRRSAADRCPGGIQQIVVCKNKVGAAER
jgi:hypothetical protein